MSLFTHSLLTQSCAVKLLNNNNMAYVDFNVTTKDSLKYMEGFEQFSTRL